ncbi:MAG TPA: caspase family protein [Anaeromyxobacteraceae bacterium]|jgi:uncharacterized caspase-like protein
MWQRARPSTLAGALALAGLSCASLPLEKGRLVPAEVAREKLDAAYAPRRLALLVGIDRFDDAAWKQLRYPEKDAADLAAVLRDPARGAFDDVEVLGGGPTRESLRAALGRLAARNRDERDTVVIYLSSHGTLARDGRGDLRRYLVARDTRLADVAGTALSMDELKGEFERLRSRRRVLVLAACHSGGGKSLLPADVQLELEGVKSGFFVRPIEEVSRASVVLAASDWGETAREDERLGNDVYTHFLVEAMREAHDRNGDGAVTASEAHDYARRRTYEFSGGRQRPSAETAEVGADPIVLVGRVERRGKPELYSYAARLDGFTLRVDGRPLAEFPGGAAVEAGRRRVEVAKGGGPALVDERLLLGPGERLDVERLLERAHGVWEVAPRAGGMGFLDAGSRSSVLPPTWAGGVALVRRDWPAPRLALRLDLLGSAGAATLRQAGQTARYDYSAWTAGAAIPYRFPVGGALSILAGPRLSAVWLHRRFHIDLAAPESYWTLTPGLLGGLSWESGRVTAGVEAHVDWMFVNVDGRSRSAGFGAVVGGVGWRF